MMAGLAEMCNLPSRVELSFPSSVQAVARAVSMPAFAIPTASMRMPRKASARSWRNGYKHQPRADGFARAACFMALAPAVAGLCVRRRTSTLRRRSAMQSISLKMLDFGFGFGSALHSDVGVFHPSIQMLGHNGPSRLELFEVAGVAVEGFFVTCYDAASCPSLDQDDMTCLRKQVYDDLASRYGPGPGRRGFLLVAKDAPDGVVIGCIGIEALPMNDLPLSLEALRSLGESADRIVAYMSNLCVLDRFRGKGVGRQLIREAEAKVLAMSQMREVALLVNKDNAPARGLYESLGYVEMFNDPWAVRCIPGRGGHLQKVRAINLCYSRNLAALPAS